MNTPSLYFFIAALALTVFYLPTLLVFYWLTHVRRQASANRQAIRTKELSFFFMRTLDETWKLGSHLLMSLLPSLVMAVGCYLSALSLTTLLGAKASTLVGGLSLDAVERYIRPVFFGFLGAYMFMLQTTLRRYLDDDLNIDVHIVIAVRVVLALIVSFVAGFLLPARYDNLGSTTLTVVVYGAAFIFGVVPEQGFETLFRIVTGWLGEKLGGEDTHTQDLQECLGFRDRVRLARLDVENIKTVDDIAYVEIERLAQKTRFDLQTLFHWVDRAVFYGMFKESPARAALEAQGIRTFSAFETVYRDSESRKSIQATVAGTGEIKPAAAGEEKGTAGAAAKALDLDVAYAAMVHIPNTQLVRLFMGYKAMQVTGSFEAANRASAFEQMGQYTQAVQEYSTALSRNPFDPTLLTRLGRAQTMHAQQQMRQGDFAGGQRTFQSALHSFQGALSILPSLWEARVQRAITLLSQKPYLSDQKVIDGQLDRAIRDLTEARKHNTGELEIVNWLGLAHLERGNYREAINLGHGAIKACTPLTPPHAKATAELIVARAKIAQAREGSDERREQLLKEAYHSITEAQSLMPRSSLLFLTQALYYHLSDPGSRQEERFLELALQPGDVYGPMDTARVQANEWMSSLAFHAGGDRADEVYEMWGRLKRDRGEVRAAIACFTQAIAQNPARVSTYLQRGALYERLGDLDAAMADYDLVIKTLECESTDVYLARARAASLISVRRPQFRAQAEQDIERAIALAPTRPEGQIALGDWLRLTGEHIEALETYVQAERLVEALRQQDGQARNGLETNLRIGKGLAYCGLADHRQSLRELRQADRLVGGERKRAARAWLSWGVFYALNTADPESRMNSRDALVRLAQEEEWAEVGAADLRQMDAALAEQIHPADQMQPAAFATGVQAMDQASQIQVQLVQARMAALLGTDDVLDKVDAVCAHIASLTDEAQKADLNSLLQQADELERFM